MTKSTGRRRFLERTLALPALLGSAVKADGDPAPQVIPSPLSVVCVGGHPDDPESGCGGTLTMYAALGHRVTIVYLTRGERGIPGKSLGEAAAIRTAEAETACRLIGAKPVFAGQIDGDTELTRSRVDEMIRILDAAAPDIVFTHWPMDTHQDHQVASFLTMSLPRWESRRTQRAIVSGRVGRSAVRRPD